MSNTLQSNTLQSNTLQSNTLGTNTLLSASLFDTYILDTGDHNILAFENANMPVSVIQTVISLYEQIDVSINLIKLDIRVNKDVKEFIKSTCGRTIPYNNSAIVIGKLSENGIVYGNIVGKLTHDLEQIIQFHKIKAFWSSYGKDYLEAPKPTVPVSLSDNDVKANDKYDTLFGLYSSESNQSPILVNSGMFQDPIQDSTKSHTVIFNNVYNVALFVSNIFNIKSVCEEFPEFEIVESFDCLKLDPTVAQTCFNKKTFPTKQCLIEKIESFKKLYDLPSATNIKKEDDEKEKVMQFITNMYITDNEPANKIGASELYNIVMNNLCIPYEKKTAFRKRLAGYFIEMGLTRKRYADGYYYYGIQQRYDDAKKSEPVSIEDILNKRLKEVESLKPLPPPPKTCQEVPARTL